jgi:dihydroorotase-like cyclic amidohydrolase
MDGELFTKRPEAMSRDELEEEVAWLRSNAAMALFDDRVAALMSDFGLTANEGRMALGLYLAGRPVSTRSAAAMTRPSDHHKETGPTLTKVYVCAVRRKLGAETIETMRGMGWRMTEAGRAMIAGSLLFHGLAGVDKQPDIAPNEEARRG